MKIFKWHRLEWSIVGRGMIVLAALALVLIGTVRVSIAEWVWPKETSGKEGTLFIYQPQLELFKGNKVNARAAIALHKKKEKEPIFGVFWFSARVVTERETRTVSFEDLKIEKINFPNEVSDEDKRLASSLLNQVPTLPNMSMSLDQFLSITRTIEQGRAVADKLNMEPPKILFATTPSVLVIINGKPILRDVEGTTVQRVVNTPYVMLFDPASSAYYLKGGNLWYRTSDIKGSWERTLRPSEAVSSAAVRIAEPEDPKLKPLALPKTETVPKVIVATEPTELIVSQGDPEYAVISGTDLLYMTNTQSDVFMDIKSRQYYVVLAGRWYRSPSLIGESWEYVPSSKLPAPFYQIPPESEKGHVLTFVADTRQAEEAVMDAQTPQTAAIKRKEARIEVTYDGPPKFKQINGTDVEYAVNTSYQVLRIKGMYYACHQAVWYVSDSPTGPWVVSDYRPQEVDSIPPESPAYNVKYVYIYDSTPEVVYVGYTPGYGGTYIYGGTVVYGTGYVYPGWYGTVYYPAPITWGLAPWYYPYYGFWGFGCGFTSGIFLGFGVGVIGSPWWGWGGWWYPWYGYYPYYPYYPPHYHYYHHPYHPNYHHFNPPLHVHPYVRHIGIHNVYNRLPNAAWNSQPRREYRLDQRTSSLQRQGSQRTSSSSSGTGRDARMSGSKISPSERLQKEGRGSGIEQRAPSSRTPPYSQRSGGVQQGRDPRERTGPLGGNNVFATRDGQVYRRTEKGWEQRERGSWTRPQIRDQQGFSHNRQGLERDFHARSYGFERENRPRGFGASPGGNPGRNSFQRGNPGIGTPRGMPGRPSGSVLGRGTIGRNGGDRR